MDGISFIVRVRNEEEFLEASLRSISGLSVPHDIHVILHMCTDRSREIAENLKSEGMPIHIHTYDYPISRAGYETLITDNTSPHSLVEYYRWCFAKGNYAWLFKWDADFLMTSPLRELINLNDWKMTERHTRYYLQARNSDSNSAEHHLFSGPYTIYKYIFWEVIGPVGDCIDLEAGDAHMIHCSTLNVKKSYWLEEPWFINDSSDEAAVLRKKYEFLNNTCGPETVGSARRANPDNDSHFFSVRRSQYILEQSGIMFFI